MQLIATIALIGLFLWIVTRSTRSRRTAFRSRHPVRYRGPSLYRNTRPGWTPPSLPPERVAKLKDMAGTAHAHVSADMEPKPENARAIWALRVHGHADENDLAPGIRRVSFGEGRRFAAQHRAAMRGSRVRRGRRVDGGASMTLKKKEEE